MVTAMMIIVIIQVALAVESPVVAPTYGVIFLVVTI